MKKQLKALPFLYFSCSTKQWTIGHFLTIVSKSTWKTQPLLKPPYKLFFTFFFFWLCYWLCLDNLKTNHLPTWLKAHNSLNLCLVAFLKFDFVTYSTLIALVESPTKLLPKFNSNLVNFDFFDLSISVTRLIILN